MLTTDTYAAMYVYVKCIITMLVLAHARNSFEAASDPVYIHIMD